MPAGVDLEAVTLVGAVGHGALDVDVGGTELARHRVVDLGDGARGDLGSELAQPLLHVGGNVVAQRVGVVRRLRAGTGPAPRLKVARGRRAALERDAARRIGRHGHDVRARVFALRRQRQAQPGRRGGRDAPVAVQRPRMRPLGAAIDGLDRGAGRELARRQAALVIRPAQPTVGGELEQLVVVEAGPVVLAAVRLHGRPEVEAVSEARYVQAVAARIAERIDGAHEARLGGARRAGQQ